MPQDPETLLQGTHLLWRGRENAHHAPPCLPTGFAALDAKLPGGGWPKGSLAEIITPHWGIGELRLLLPILSRFTHDERWLAWINPPHLPYPPALAQGGVNLAFCLLLDQIKLSGDVLWSMEKLLRQGDTGAVLAWPTGEIGSTDLRRLALAAATGNSLGILFLKRKPDLSLAALRLELMPKPGGLVISILKARGSWWQGTISIDL